jgi:hypothetical protein
MVRLAIDGVHAGRQAVTTAATVIWKVPPLGADLHIVIIGRRAAASAKPCRGAFPD